MCKCMLGTFLNANEANVEIPTGIYENSILWKLLSTKLYQGFASKCKNLLKFIQFKTENRTQSLVTFLWAKELKFKEFKCPIH